MKIPVDLARSEEVNILTILDLDYRFPKLLDQVITGLQGLLEAIPEEYRSTAQFDLNNYSEPGRDHPMIGVTYRRPKGIINAWIEQLLAFPETEAMPGLVALLRSPISTDRQATLDALRKLGSPGAIAALSAALNDEADLIRWNAFRALAELAGRQSEGGFWEPQMKDLNEPTLKGFWRGWARDHGDPNILSAEDIAPVPWSILLEKSVLKFNNLHNIQPIVELTFSKPKGDFPKSLSDTIAFFQTKAELIAKEYRSVAELDLKGIGERRAPEPVITLGYRRPKTKEERDEYLKEQAQRAEKAKHSKDIAALANSPAEEALPKLAVVLRSSPDQINRLQAINVLDRFRNAEAIGILTIGLDDSESGVRQRTMMVLANQANRKSEGGFWNPHYATMAKNEQGFIDHWKKWASPKSKMSLGARVIGRFRRRQS